MKLIRVGEAGLERPAVLMSEDHFYDVSEFGDFNEQFFRGDSLPALSDHVATLVRQRKKPELLGAQRLGAPIGRPHQIVCIGLNYADHAAETGAEIPSEPIIFTKPPNTLVGPFDDVRIPPTSVKTDWEVELAIVIGSQSRYLNNEGEALKNIAGYMVANDVSEREFQLERQGQWSKGKSAETFNPAGPWLVTKAKL